MGKARDRRIKWLEYKKKAPRGYDYKISHGPGWFTYCQTCTTCGGRAEWCSGCEMWSCHDCDPYGTCMCN